MKNDPAFPEPIKQGCLVEPFPGLSKREYFAAAALQGFCAREGLGTSDEGPNKMTVHLDEISIVAVNIADALIAELERTKDAK